MNRTQPPAQFSNASIKIDERSHFIELMAFWEGRINAPKLEEEFGVCRPQCSKLLKKYKAAHPLNLRYDSSSKAYLPTEQFSPAYISRAVDDYLAFTQLGIRHPSHVAALGQSLAIPKRFAPPAVIRVIVEAIRKRQRVEVDYISLSNPDPEGRIIVPHAFVSTGLRWHLRAFCEKRQAYRDFVLSRFRGNADVQPGPSENGPEKDTEWNTLVTLVIKPDPRLDPKQIRVLEEDYDMQNGQLCITTKACLVDYLLREMQISTKMLDGKPEAQQLILVNLDDMKPWLFDHKT